jgi:pyruvate/2-oxoglutarate dehydrogenase complex dihydrolipoamide acyltransferase (E2) component
MVAVLFCVAVDAGLHFVMRWVQGIPMHEVFRDTGRAICGAALTSMLGFGALLLAEHAVLRSVGAVLVLGHVDATGSAPASQALTKERAQSIASIFSLSGLKQDRLMLRGMGDLMPRAANDSTQGRALNRRMEIMFTQRTTMLALLSKYNSGKTPPVAEMVAVQNAPAPAAPAAKAPAKKAPATKKAAAKPAAKKAPAKPAAKKPAPAKAKAAAPATNDQAKN